jgi:hypothetical protein
MSANESKNILWEILRHFRRSKARKTKIGRKILRRVFSKYYVGEDYEI